MVDEDRKPTFEEFLQRLFIQSQAKLTKLLQDELVRVGNEKEPYRFKSVLESGLDLRDSEGRPIDLHDFPIVGKIQQLCEKVEGYDDKVASYLSIYMVKAINDFMRTVSNEPTSARKEMVIDIIDSMQKTIDAKKEELAQKTDEYIMKQLENKEVRDAVSELYKGLDSAYRTISSEEVRLDDLTLHKEDMVLKSMYRLLTETYEGITPHLIAISRAAKDGDRLDTSRVMIDSVDSDKFAYHVIKGGYLNLTKHDIELEKGFRKALEESDGLSLLYVAGDSLDIEQKKSDKFLEAFGEQLREVEREWAQKKGIKSKYDMEAIQRRALKNMENNKALETAVDMIEGLGGKIVVYERSMKDRSVVKSYVAEDVEFKDNAVYARIKTDAGVKSIKVLELGDSGFRAVAKDRTTYYDLGGELDRAGVVVVDGIVSDLTKSYLEKLSASDYIKIISLQKEERKENGVERKTDLSLKNDIDTIASLLDIKYASGFDKIESRNYRSIDGGLLNVGRDTYITFESDQARGGSIILEGMGDTVSMAAKEARYAVDTIKIMEEKGVKLLPGLNASYMAIYRTINENLEGYKEEARKEITEKLAEEMKTRILLDTTREGESYIEKTVNDAINKLKDKYGDGAADEIASYLVKMDMAKGDTYVKAKESFYTTMAEAYKSLVELVVPQDVVRELETRGSDMLGVTNNGYIRNPLDYQIRDGRVAETPYVMLAGQVDISLPGHYAMEAIADIMAL